jgi:hypothetical protein
MKIPPNSVPMVGSPGPHGYITMGAHTNVKVRQDLGDLRPEEGKDFSYGGWYENPPDTQAIAAHGGRTAPPTSTACPSPREPGNRCTTCR